MKTNNKFVAGPLIAVSLAMSWPLGYSAEKPEKTGHQLTASVSTVEDVSLPVGTNLTISIDLRDLNAIKKMAANNDPHLPVFFEWRKNHISLPGETNTTLTLQNLTTTNVGSYTLLYKGGSEGETAPVHVGVYIDIHGSTGRKLTEPIGKFIIQNNGLGACAVGKTFGRYKTYTPFPSSTYPDGGEPLLTVETCFPENGSTLDTAVVIKENTIFMTQVGCSDAQTPSCGSNADLANCTITRTPGMTYRVTIYLKNVGSIDPVTWQYLFHN